MNVRQIHLHELAKFLAQPSAGGLLIKGVASTGHRLSVEDVIGLLHSGDMQLWAVEDSGEVVAVFLSEVVAYPRLRVLRLFGLAGARLKEIAPLMAVIKAWGQEQGCSELEAVATRRGLEVIFPDFRSAGYHLVMSLEAEEKAA